MPCSVNCPSSPGQSPASRSPCPFGGHRGASEPRQPLRRKRAACADQRVWADQDVHACALQFASRSGVRVVGPCERKQRTGPAHPFNQAEPLRGTVDEEDPDRCSAYCRKSHGTIGGKGVTRTGATGVGTTMHTPASPSRFRTMTQSLGRPHERVRDSSSPRLDRGVMLGAAADTPNDRAGPFGARDHTVRAHRYSAAPSIAPLEFDVACSVGQE